MAATIKIKNSSTAGAAPTASDLVQGELAVNVTDKRLYTENSGGTIVELGTNPSVPVTFPDGSASAPSLTNSGDTNTGMFFPAADTIAFAEGGTETMRLDSSGNMGLGVTPSAWGQAGTIAALQIKNTSLAGSGANAYWGANWFGGGFDKYIQTGAASLYVQTGGQHIWYNAGSGTAGNSISFTQAMTLNASGNLIVGATSDSGSRFKVVGSGGGELYIDASGKNFYNGSEHVFQNGGGLAVYGKFDSSGNLLVGTTSSNGRINVLSGSASQSAITTNGVTGDTVYQAILVSKFDNNSTTSQNFIQFQINNGGANCGKITANGANTAAFGSTSDRRVKENIVNLPSQLDKIMALRPVEYDYIESYGGGHQIGFIAQEMQQVYPDVISEDDTEEKILSITGWSKTEARLVKAIQELKAIVDAQAAEIAALKG